LLNFLYTAISWVLLQWHHLFNAIGLDPASGINWALSIVFLVITARVLLFRLFIKQVKYQRQMTALQPEIKKIQQKYKNDRQAQQQAMMKLQQEHGFNPLSGCLPLLVQMPIFIALFHVLRHLSNSLDACTSNPTSSQLTLYGFTSTETCNAAQAKLFGGAPLAAKLFEPAETLKAMGGERGVTVVTILVLVLISAVATFSTQKFARAANPVQPEGQAAMIANLMQYLIPLGTLGSGLFFPLGVLLYWFTSNTWTLAQQVYVNKFHPHEAPAAATHDVGKAAAPRVGAKPVRPGSQARVIDVPVADDETDAPDDGGSSTPPTQQSPRPGQRPNRPSGGPRKPANQRKKRR
jgi:YidC/Oxa1 family membrane protein insertase